jgi:NAD+ kinase
MKIAIFGIKIDEGVIHEIHAMVKKLLLRKNEVVIHENIIELFSNITCGTFLSVDDIIDFDLVLSVGGDGTILESLELVRSHKIPVLGINTGRLGFLSNVSISEIDEAIEQINSDQLVLEKRSLIELVNDDQLFEYNIGLNEITIHKKDSSSMITVHAYIEGEYFSTYWADGLIISTPTGSTGYSLSCGGPIVSPGSGNFILTPIAPHNLNVRPLIIPDQEKITLKFEGRSDEFLLSIDSRSISIQSDKELIIKKADYPFHLSRLKSHSFSKTLRDKLMWGVDKRNK